MSRTYRKNDREQVRKVRKLNRETRRMAEAIEDSHTYRKVPRRVTLRKLTRAGV